LSTYEFVRKKMTEMPPEKIRPKPLVTGDDLISAGYEPGPRFREILDAVENAQLEERLLTREAGMEFVRREFPLGAEKNDAPRARAEC
jgi:poly(A) polymerase